MEPDGVGEMTCAEGIRVIYEAAGEANRPVTDPSEIVDAMYCVLTNEALRADLRLLSLQRAARFDWRKTAMETVAVYEEAFARNRR